MLAVIVCFGLSALASVFGLAAIIGAFLAGMVFAEYKERWPCEQSFEAINELMSPFFFVFVGIQVSLSVFADLDLLLFAIAMIYLVMAAVFESTILPISIVTSILMAAIGVIWTLFVTRTTFTFMALIGIQILMGVVVNIVIGMIFGVGMAGVGALGSLFSG